MEYERFGVVRQFHVTRALTFFGIGADPRPGSVGAVGDFARTYARRSRASNSLDRTSEEPQRASSVPEEGSGTASSSETKPPGVVTKSEGGHRRLTVFCEVGPIFSCRLPF